MMSFSTDIKEELSKLNNLANKVQVKYELIGYLLTNNVNLINSKEITYSTENQYNINRFSKLLSNLKIEHQIQIDGLIYVIRFKIKDIFFINKLNKEKINVENFDMEKNEKEENEKYIIRGAFLGSGSINNPNSRYHLEIIFSNINNEKYIENILNKFDINVKALVKENKVIMYIKDGEKISKFLALIGASKAILKFENVRVEKQMRSKVNRIVNCETANLNKTINAAIEQIEAIKKLQNERKFNKLDENLKEIALLRLKYPDISLVELGKKLEKPLGKSGVNYRLKKIIEIANVERK